MVETRGCPPLIAGAKSAKGSLRNTGGRRGMGRLSRSAAPWTSIVRRPPVSLRGGCVS